MKIEKLILGELQTNCYILADENRGEAILIDAPSEADVILNKINELGCRLQKIVLTHAHFDHIMALDDIKKATGAPVFLHKDDTLFLKDTVLNLAHYFDYIWEPVEYEGVFTDGDIIDFGGEKIEVLHTPGHTSGCICLLTGNVLFSGDTLFQRSVGRVDHPTGDLEQEILSIKEKLMPLPDATIVYPGHGFATTIGEERRENPYLQ